MASTDIHWHLSGGAGNSDPDLSLGGVRSTATELYEFQSTLTASQTAGQEWRFVDSTRIGDGANAHVGKWLLMMDGNNQFFAARIIGFDTASGRFHVDRLPALDSTSGDTYQVFSNHNLYDAVSAAESAAGVVDYRMLYARNETGGTITASNFWFEYLDLGPSEVEMIPSATVGSPDLVISPDTEDPTDSTGQIRGTVFLTENGFGREDSSPVQPEEAVPINEVNSWANTSDVAIWLKRTTPAFSGVRRRCAVLVRSEGSTQGATIIAWEVAGYTPSVSLVRDRDVFIGGGARVIATVVTVEDGSPVDELPVTLSVDALGSLVGVDVEPETDDDGVLGATYTAPIDPAEAGNTADIEFTVGAGEEVL